LARKDGAAGDRNPHSFRRRADHPPIVVVTTVWYRHAGQKNVSPSGSAGALPSHTHMHTLNIYYRYIHPTTHACIYTHTFSQIYW
jgi:hypothetical protein